MSTASEWGAVVVGGVQFAAGIGLTAWTFSNQREQSRINREADWFHRVVVDPTIHTLHNMVEKESELLEISAMRCQQAKTGNLPPQAIDECFLNELQAFRARLRPVQNKLTQLAFIFDGDLQNQVSAKCEALEDGVTEWFDELQRQGQVDGRKHLMETVCDCHRELLNDFREFEFRTLPSLHQNAQRGMMWLFLPLLLMVAGVTLRVLPQWSAGVSIVMAGGSRLLQLQTFVADALFAYALILGSIRLGRRIFVK